MQFIVVRIADSRVTILQCCDTLQSPHILHEENECAICSSTNIVLHFDENIRDTASRCVAACFYYYFYRLQTDLDID